jgi:aryl-alcohol dehydrogenase-like predicted oxidoreductase
MCMKMKRREFLKQSTFAVGGLLTSVRYVTAAQPDPARFDPYEKVSLGKTGLKVPRFCLGTGANGWEGQSDQTRLGKKGFTELIRGAHERGIRLFDSADLYGSHPYFIPALQGVPRDQYFIVSKMWFGRGGLPTNERPDADVLLPRFLKELQTDYIDLLLLHCVTSPQWPVQLRKQMDILSKYKEKGTIRALGVSCHSLPALEAAVSEPWVESVHARINPYGINMDASPKKVMPVLKQLHDAGKGVVGMKIIGAGELSNDDAGRDASVRFSLESGCVDVLNVGCASLSEVDDLATRVRKVQVKA